jgi:hypothetical protein
LSGIFFFIDVSFFIVILVLAQRCRLVVSGIFSIFIILPFSPPSCCFAHMLRLVEEIFFFISLLHHLALAERTSFLLQCMFAYTATNKTCGWLCCTLLQSVALCCSRVRGRRRKWLRFLTRQTRMAREKICSLRPHTLVA